MKKTNLILIFIKIRTNKIKHWIYDYTKNKGVRTKKVNQRENEFPKRNNVQTMQILKPYSKISLVLLLNNVIKNIHPLLAKGHLTI